MQQYQGSRLAQHAGTTAHVNRHAASRLHKGRGRHPPEWVGDSATSLMASTVSRSAALSSALRRCMSAEEISMQPRGGREMLMSRGFKAGKGLGAELDWSGWSGGAVKPRSLGGDELFSDSRSGRPLGSFMRGSQGQHNGDLLLGSPMLPRGQTVQPCNCVRASTLLAGRYSCVAEIHCNTQAARCSA